jgi:hypothetical protein
MAVASSDLSFFTRPLPHYTNKQYSFNFTARNIQDSVVEKTDIDMLGRCTSAPAELEEFDIAYSEQPEPADCGEQLSSSRPPLENIMTCCRKRRRLQTSTDWLMLKRSTSAPAELYPSSANTSGPEGELEIVSWNIASPNLNPLEYWVTHESQSYSDLMCSVQKAIDEPKDEDIELGRIFTPSMFQELKSELSAHNIQNLEELELIWENQMVRFLVHPVVLTTLNIVFFCSRSSGRQYLVF